MGYSSLLIPYCIRMLFPLYVISIFNIFHFLIYYSVLLAYFSQMLFSYDIFGMMFSFYYTCRNIKNDIWEPFIQSKFIRNIYNMYASDTCSFVVYNICDKYLQGYRINELFRKQGSCIMLPVQKIIFFFFIKTLSQ